MARHDNQNVLSCGQLGTLHPSRQTLQFDGWDIVPFLQPRVAEQWQSAVCNLLGILGSRLVFNGSAARERPDSYNAMRAYMSMHRTLPCVADPALLHVLSLTFCHSHFSCKAVKW